MGKKIAFLSYYSGTVNRGVETYVNQLSQELSNLGHKVKIYQNNSKYKSIKQFTQETLRNLDKNTDILIATNGRWQSFLCKVWCVIHKKKLVIPGQSGPGIDDRINLWMFPDVFVGLTQHQCNWAKKVNPFVKTINIPNGVDTQLFKNNNNSNKLSKPTILVVAALEPIKRLDLAIKAISKLKNCSLLIVGRGKQEQDLKKLGNNLLPGRFNILSYDHTQMPQVYKTVNLFTYPTSPWESFGIAMLEAMASGLAVVASNDPIRREIVGNAGIFVDPKNTDEYAKALDKAVNMKWGEKPRIQAEKFSWGIIAEKYDELFKSLVK